MNKVTLTAKRYHPEDFETLTEEFLNTESQLLNWKASEYTAGTDRLQNFRQVAQWLNKRPAEVALCYLLKHIQSITLAVNSGKFSWEWQAEAGEGMKQRIADARNYLLLLAACLDEEFAEENFKNERNA
jgi:hypothetical protein